MEAGELAVGEHVKTLAGLSKVVSLTPHIRNETVYNLEVLGEHVYLVGSSGTLVHNNYEMHHSIPKAIQKKLPQRLRTNRDIIGRQGLPNRIKVKYSLHRDIHSGRGYIANGGIGGGHYNNRFLQEMERKNRNFDLLEVDDILDIRDMLVIEFGL